MQVGGIDELLFVDQFRDAIQSTVTHGDHRGHLVDLGHHASAEDCPAHVQVVRKDWIALIVDRRFFNCFWRRVAHDMIL